MFIYEVALYGCRGTGTEESKTLAFAESEIK